MARSLGAILLAALLVSTGEALGACAWVLWARAKATGPTEGFIASAMMATWQPYSSHATKEKCDRAATNEPSIKAALLAEHGLKTEAILFVRCLPDTVDPRSRGKG